MPVRGQITETEIEACIMRMLPISVVIPTLNAEAYLARCVAALSSTAEIIVPDGGSTDGTRELAVSLGASCICAPAGRGPQLIAGAARARCDWLLFIHADTVLETGWEADVEAFIDDPSHLGRAAAFTFALDDASHSARWLEAGVRLRSRHLGFPYGDQGLLISRSFYDALSGYKPLMIMEDVDIIRRIGRARLTVLSARAVTSADRWQREGFLKRSSRNLTCLAMYYAGLPQHAIKRLYG